MWKYSEVLDVEWVKIGVEESPLFELSPSARIHKNAELADEGSREWKKEWQVYHRLSSGYNPKDGEINPSVGNLAALLGFECIPDRLPMLGYVFGYYFSCSDNYDVLGKMESNVQGRLMHELQVSGEDGDPILESWKSYMQDICNEREINIKTIEEYFKYRLKDPKTRILQSFLQWGAGIKFTKDNKKLTQPLTDIACGALVLVIDYYSWGTEAEGPIKEGKHGVSMNALRSLMRWNDIGHDEARSMLKSAIKKQEKVFYTLREECLSSLSRSDADGTLKWISILETNLSNSVIWSISAPRFQTRTRQPEGTYQLYPGCFVPSPGVQKTNNVPDSTFLHFCRDPNLAGALSEDTVLEPYQYVASMPGKGVRTVILEALNMWYSVPVSTWTKIKDLGELFQHASIMLDDVEDGSPLRRSSPAAHMIFGVAQTVNSSNLAIIKALKIAAEISQQALLICIEGLHTSFIGQGHDIYHTYMRESPTESEYVRINDGKTASQLWILAKLMQSEATKNRSNDTAELLTMVGRYYGIRDDYQNLMSADYAAEKGFCEDLDEGKFSLPIIHALQSSPSNATIRNILQARTPGEMMSKEKKQLVLKHLESCGSLTYTRKVLGEMHNDLLRRISVVEQAMGSKNQTLRGLLERLRI